MRFGVRGPGGALDLARKLLPYVIIRDLIFPRYKH